MQFVCLKGLIFGIDEKLHRYEAANLEEAYLAEVNLENTNFKGVNIEGAKA